MSVTLCTKECIECHTHDIRVCAQADSPTPQKVGKSRKSDTVSGGEQYSGRGGTPDLAYLTPPGVRA